MLLSALSWWASHNINSAIRGVHYLKKSFQADMILTLFYCFGSLTTGFAFMFCAISNALVSLDIYSLIEYTEYKLISKLPSF